MTTLMTSVMNEQMGTFSFNPKSPKTTIDYSPKPCSVCSETAWYLTGEPTLKEPMRFFCAYHRAEARARQRSIWGYDSTVLEEERIILTAREKRVSVFIHPNNKEVPEGAKDA